MQLGLLFEVSNLSLADVYVVTLYCFCWSISRSSRFLLFSSSPSKMIDSKMVWSLCVCGFLSFILSFTIHNHSKRTFGQQKQQNTSHQTLADGHMHTRTQNYKRMRQSCDVFFIAFTARWEKMGKEEKSAARGLEGNEETIDRKSAEGRKGRRMTNQNFYAIISLEDTMIPSFPSQHLSISYFTLLQHQR